MVGGRSEEVLAVVVGGGAMSVGDEVSMVMSGINTSSKTSLVRLIVQSCCAL